MKINYSFEVIDNRTKQRVEKKTYTSVQGDIDYHKPLKARNENGEVSIYCTCSNHIELKVSVSNPVRPYLYPAKLKGQKHGADCCRHSDYQGVSDYEKAWNYNEENDEYSVNVQEFIPNKKEINNPIPLDNGKKLYIPHPDGKRKGKATVFGLATKLNMMAWEKLVTGSKKKLPVDREELSKQIYGLARNIKINNKLSLQSMFYDNKINKENRISNLIPKKDIAFVYMEYLPEKRGDFDAIGSKAYDFIVCKNHYGKEIGFYVDIDEFEEKLKSEPHSDTYIVAGFAYRESAYHHRKLTLGNYCLIPVSDRGLFVESSHEKDYYDNLCENNRMFIKPYLPIEEYGGFIPDYIIYDENEKPLIGEIFGIHGNDDYDERKEEKIEISQTEEFQSVYRFGYIEK